MPVPFQNCRTWTSPVNDRSEKALKARKGRMHNIGTRVGYGTSIGVGMADQFSRSSQRALVHARPLGRYATFFD